MSSSERLGDHLWAMAAVRGITIDEKWLPAVELHFQKLIDAATVVEQSGMKSQDLAPKFEP